MCNLAVSNGIVFHAGLSNTTSKKLSGMMQSNPLERGLRYFFHELILSVNKGPAATLVYTRTCSACEVGIGKTPS